MDIGTYFVEFGVGKMVKELPLPGMSRHVFVSVDECAIRKDAMVGPQIGKLVGTARILNEELKRGKKGDGSDDEIWFRRSNRSINTSAFFVPVWQELLHWLYGLLQCPRKGIELSAAYFPAE